jgi:hypothetical protein
MVYNYLKLGIFGIAMVLLAGSVNASQVLDPDQDVNNPDSWTTAPLFSKINDNNDATFIISPLLITPKRVNISLDSGVWPGTNQSALHRIRIRSREQATGGMIVKPRMKIFQDNNLIMTTNLFSVGTAFAWDTELLTAAEKAKISSYENLTVEIYGEGSIALPRDRLEVAKMNFWIPTAIYFGMLKVTSGSYLPIKSGGNARVR